MNRVFVTSRIPRLSALVLPLAVLFSTLMIGSASADTSVCAQAFGSFSSSNFPSSCWRPYSSSSPFNRPLPANPSIASDSASIISNLTANDVNFEGGSGQFAFTSDDGRDGVYYSRPSDPVVTIHCTYYWGPGTCSGANKVNVDAQQIHIPAGAMPQDNGSDMHMTVVDQSQRRSNTTSSTPPGLLTTRPSTSGQAPRSPPDPTSAPDSAAAAPPPASPPSPA